MNQFIVRVECHTGLFRLFSSRKPLTVRDVLRISKIYRFVPWVCLSYDDSDTNVGFNDFDDTVVSSDCTIGVSPPLTGG